MLEKKFRAKKAIGDGYVYFNFETTPEPYIKGTIEQYIGRKVGDRELYENDTVLSMDGEEMTVVWCEEDYTWYFKTDNGVYYETFIDVLDE
jgi:hypothetical protein